MSYTLCCGRGFFGGVGWAPVVRAGVANLEWEGVEGLLIGYRILVGLEKVISG